MSEKFTPNEQFLRDEAAKQIKAFRTSEKEREYNPALEGTHARGILEYTRGLMGMVHFLSYVKSLSFGKVKLLDIGTGDGRGMAELMNSESLSYNLDIIGTSLTKNKFTKRNLGDERIILTPAETLKPINDGEIDGIISVHGIGHSKSPELVADSINRVLVPSGVLKTTYVDFNNPENDLFKKFNECHERLISQLKSNGFDVAVFKKSSQNFKGEEVWHMVMAAIKQPVVGITANKLLALDFADYDEQIINLEKEGFKYYVEREDGDYESGNELESLIREIESQF